MSADPQELPENRKNRGVMELRGSKRAAEALAEGKNYQDAAHLAGINRRTLFVRRQDPAFMEYVRERRADMFEATAGKLTETSQAAADKLADLLDSESEQTALSAARAILEHATRLRELLEIDVRLAALEKALATQEEQ